MWIDGYKQEPDAMDSNAPLMAALIAWTKRNRVMLAVMAACIVFAIIMYLCISPTRGHGSPGGELMIGVFGPVITWAIMREEEH